MDLVPTEILVEEVFARLSPIDLSSPNKQDLTLTDLWLAKAFASQRCSQVSRRWRQVLQANVLWKRWCLRHGWESTEEAQEDYEDEDEEGGLSMHNTRNGRSNSEGSNWREVVQIRYPRWRWFATHAEEGLARLLSASSEGSQAGWEKTFLRPGETHEICVKKHTPLQRSLLSIRIKKIISGVSADTVARFLANTTSRETWDVNLSDIEVLATLSQDLKFVRLNYGGVTATFLVNKVKRGNQYVIVEHSVIDEDVPDSIPISPGFFSFQESQHHVNVVFILGSGFIVTPVQTTPMCVTEIEYVVQMVQARWSNLLVENERQYLQGFAFNRAEILETLEQVLSHIHSDDKKEENI